MVFDPVPPFLADAAVAETRDHDRVFDWNRALVIIAVERPGLYLPLVELAAVQQAVKRVQAVVTRRADDAKGGFQFIGVLQHGFTAERIRAHAFQLHAICRWEAHSVISVPSAGMCQPARSTVLRSVESCSQAGFELLICKNIFLAMPRPSSAAIAPCSPDIAICPMLCPVLLPSFAAINSSSRHTVPSKKTKGAPANRDFRSSVTPAQAARK